MSFRDISPFTTPRTYANKDINSRSNIFEKLTDANLYTGTHKHRFNQHGKGLGKQGRIDPSLDMKNLDELVYRRSSPFKPRIQNDKSAEIKKKSKSPVRAKTPNISKYKNIYDKLTDHTIYTGIHKLRFAKDGRGRGKNGRDPYFEPKDLQNLVATKF